MQPKEANALPTAFGQYDEQPLPLSLSPALALAEKRRRIAEIDWTIATLKHEKATLKAELVAK
jgi:uncharacterized small protein (DUF1192 family)